MRTSPPRASASPRPKSTPSPHSRPRKSETDTADAHRRCGTKPDPTPSRLHGRGNRAVADAGSLWRAGAGASRRTDGDAWSPRRRRPSCRHVVGRVITRGDTAQHPNRLPLQAPRRPPATPASRGCPAHCSPTGSRSATPPEPRTIDPTPTKEDTMLSNHRSRGALITSAAVPATLASTVAPIAASQAAHAVARRQRRTLGVVCAATALLLFNVTAPIVALPSVAADLRLSFTSQQWVLSSYALVLASLLLAGGALGDRFGRRRLFLAGLGVFAVGSAVAALAGSGVVLIVGRSVQGIGAAAIFPAGLALVAAEFDGAARARAIGIWGATVSAAIALGPLGGGVLVEAFSWRASFLVGVVLAVPTAATAARHVRESRALDAPALDIAGTVALTAAMFLSVFALLEGNQRGWGSAVVVGAALGAAAALAVFVVVEHRVAQPLIAPALMRNRTFAAATLVALVFAAAAFGPLTFTTQLLLRVLHGSPIAAGAELLPYAAASFGVSLLAAQVAARVGVRVTLAGGLVLCAGGLVAMHGVDPHGSWNHLIPGLVVWGAGSALVNPTVTVAALAVVPPRQSGMASGVNNSARQLGIAAGIAALGALVQSRTTAAIAAGKPFAVAYVHGVDAMLLVAGAIAAAGALTVVALVRTR